MKAFSKNNNLLKLFFLFVFLVPFCGDGFAQGGYRLFYAIPAVSSARATALGSGFAAFADDAGCAFINPAGIGFIRGYQLVPMYAGGMDSGGKGIATVAGLKHLKNIGTFAVSFQNGAMEAYSADIAGTDSWLTGDKQAVLTAARTFGRCFSIGFNFKYYFGNILTGDKYSLSDLGLGILYRSKNNIIRFGASVDNLMQNKTTITSDTSILYMGLIPISEYDVVFDRVYRGAVALTTRNPQEPTTFIASMALPEPSDTKITKIQGFANFGVEQWFRYNQPVSWGLRASFTGRKDMSAFGAGASLKIGHEFDSWRFDYSFQEIGIKDDYIDALNGDLTAGGSRHSLSVIYEFDGPKYETSYAENIGHPSEEELSEEFAELTVENRRMNELIAEDAADYITVPPPKKEWEVMRLTGRVENLSSDWENHIVFILHPEIPGECVKWKLYLSEKAPVSHMSFGEMERKADRILAGDGPVPQVINWDVLDKKDRVVGGYYYYFLVIWDDSGQAWRSNWIRFRL